MNQISRREFVAIAAGAAAPFALPQVSPAAAITAAEIVDRVKKQLGVEWKAETVDTLKAGDPGTAVTGIVTTALATMAVLRQAVKAKANMVITCQPTFYSRSDAPTPPSRRGAGPGDAAPASPADPVFSAKHDFIARSGLVVWRISDHWRMRRPDPFAQGLLTTLGWASFSSPADPSHASIPEISLDALAAQIQQKLDARGGIRVVGEPQMKVGTIAVLPGSTPIQASLRTLPGVDAIIAGEVREWESVEYARDTVAAGGRKGLILVGRVLSEEPGMNLCAQWIKSIVPEVTTTWLPVGDPYWRPL